MDHRCPICKRPAPPPETNPTAPFCSPRCRLIDLGSWLRDDYRIAGTDDDSASLEADDEG